MKKLLTILCSLPALAFAQSHTYTVQGKVGVYNSPAKIYLEFFKPGHRLVDSALLNNGQFKFSGIADSISKAYLVINAKGTGPDGADDAEIYIEPGTIIVNGAGLLINATITGTKTNNDNVRFKNAIKAAYDEWNALEAKKNATPPDMQISDAFIKEYNKENAAIQAHYFTIEAEFAKANPGSYISLRLLLDLATNVDYSVVAPLAKRLSPDLKKTLHGKELLAMLPALKAVMIGSIAPEFNIADTSGKMISLESFRGKYVLIDFWASWCGPCRKENPNVLKAFNLYKNKNFTVLGISLDNKKDDWLKAINADGLPWPQGSDLQGLQNKVAKLYGVTAIPRSFLIGPKGKIIAVDLRGNALEDKLAEIFGKI